MDSCGGVVAEPWRTALRDSMGNPVKLTWYMNCGSIYSCGVDTTPILPYELLEDNHGEAIARWGDEMAYRYHTWAWTDPDSDGVFQWNQTETFAECLADFDATIAQLVLDRRFYPCSFRSSWNWMENPWEAYLDDLFPYRFEGRWFEQGWTPYHPAAEDWRVPGGMRGWEAFHTYIPSFDDMDANDTFMMARTGIDSVVPSEGIRLPRAGGGGLRSVRGGPPALSRCRVRIPDGARVHAEVAQRQRCHAAGHWRLDIRQRRRADGEYSRIPYDPAGTLQIAVAVTDWFGNAAVQALPVPLRMGPVRVSATPTSAEVQWTANLPVSTRLELTPMPSGDTAVLVNTTPHSPHKATFTGLIPGRVYRIRVASETAGGERAQAPDSYVLTPLSGGTIVDNADSGFSVTGSWSTGSSASGRYGADYRYATTSPSGVSHADWTLTVPASGLYRVVVAGQQPLGGGPVHRLLARAGVPRPCESADRRRHVESAQDVRARRGRVHRRPPRQRRALRLRCDCRRGDDRAIVPGCRRPGSGTASAGRRGHQPSRAGRDGRVRGLLLRVGGG